MVVYLIHYQLLPEDRLAELMADLFGVLLVPATLAPMGQSCVQPVRGMVELIKDLVKTAAVKHMDETGFRVGGLMQWMHIAATVLLTFYRISPQRSNLLDGFTAIVLDKHWKFYYTSKASCTTRATPIICASSRP